jgi:hypothetical protein
MVLERRFGVDDVATLKKPKLECLPDQVNRGLGPQGVVLGNQVSPEHGSP